MMHHKNYETNPRSATRVREKPVYNVRFTASKCHKAALNLLQNEPKDGQPFRSMETVKRL
jgi:hypothetical protein